MSAEIAAIGWARRGQLPKLQPFVFVWHIGDLNGAVSDCDSVTAAVINDHFCGSRTRS
jgi:hypothetical protein